MNTALLILFLVEAAFAALVVCYIVRSAAKGARKIFSGVKRHV